MRIKIAHLYYDLMNLYGENGNVRSLTKHLEEAKIKTDVTFLSVDDKINFDKYDIFYMGMGSEDNQLIALDDLMKYKVNIKKAIDDNKIFIITGNSYELFGKYIEDLDGHIINTLDIFDYYTKRIDFRISEEQVFTTPLINEKVIGFQNRGSIIKCNHNNLFNVEKGTGYEIDSKIEGYHFNNFYGTYLVGPLLVRNPHLTDYILKKYINKYIPNTKLIDYQAYDEYKKNFLDKETNC